MEKLSTVTEFSDSFFEYCKKSFWNREEDEAFYFPIFVY